MVKADQSESATTVKSPRSSSSSSPSSSSNLKSSSGSIEASLRQHELQNHRREEPNPLRCFANALIRKKPLDCRTDTNLNRCLNLVDLTALGKYR